MMDSAGSPVGRPHHRRWSLTDAGLRCTTGRWPDEHSIRTVRWHLAPGSALQLTARGALVRTSAGEFRVGFPLRPPITLAAESAPDRAGFGRTVAAPVLACHVRLRSRVDQR